MRLAKGPLGLVLADHAQTAWRLMNDPDTAKAKRVAGGMLKMQKFDIAKLEAAAKDAST